MSEALLVPLKLPAGPHALVDQAWVATLATLEERVATIQITDAATQQSAADLQIRLTRAGKELEAARKAIKEPFIQAGKDIDQAALGPATRISRMLERLKTGLNSFYYEQEQKQIEAERARQAELARLEKIRLAEEADAQRKADAAAAEVKAAADAARATGAKVETLDLDFPEDDIPEEPPQKTETQKAIEAVQFAPAVVVTKPQGISYRTTLRIKSINMVLLPEVFMIHTPDEAKIRKLYCTGYKDGDPLPTCPGVEFSIDRTPVSTGRERF